MKKNILALALILFALFSVYGQNTDPIDLVLVLNTSSGMSSSYENVSNYITGPFLSEFLRIGDTFHLIAFSQDAKLDIARRIASLGDVETIIGRMLLQYPVESGNNTAGAISFAEQYVKTLPARPKKIVLVSTAGQEVNNLVNAAKQRLSSNTSLDFLQVTPGQPIVNVPSSGRSSSPVTGTSLPAPSAVTTQPSSQGAAGQTALTASESQSAEVSNAQAIKDTVSETVQTFDPASSSDNSSADDASAETVQVFDPASSESYGTGETNADTVGTADAQDQVKNEPKTVPVPEKLTETETKKSWAFLIPLIIGIILLLLLIWLIVFLVSRKSGSGSSPKRVMPETTFSRQDIKEDAPFIDHSKDLAEYAASQTRRTTPYADRPVKQEISKPALINPSGPLLLNLLVEDQNTAIGKRNIHSLKSGYSLTIGGGSSDFLIFLVPMPPAIGELKRNGSQLTFIPRKPKYFPDLGSSELRDCLNKPIRIISDKNYELRVRFEMYEDPLAALNRMLMSIKVPG